MDNLDWRFIVFVIFGICMAGLIFLHNVNMKKIDCEDKKTRKHTTYS